MERLFNSSHHSVRGFTLLETVVVVTLVALVGGALSSAIQYFYRTNNYVLQEGNAVQSARVGLATAVQNLREASYGDDGSYPIANAATSTITFYADINGDGKADKVRYYFASSTLYRDVTYSSGNPPTYTGQTPQTVTVATYLQNNSSTPIFQYYDNTGTLLTAPINVSSVASVLTNLLIDVDTKRSPSAYSLSGSASLRNLYNL
jgi:type II secretory pathway pseudopilin PulG